MSDIWGGKCTRDIGFTIRVGGRGSHLNAKADFFNVHKITTKNSELDFFILDKSNIEIVNKKQMSSVLLIFPLLSLQQS